MKISERSASNGSRSAAAGPIAVGSSSRWRRNLWSQPSTERRESDGRTSKLRPPTPRQPTGLARSRQASASPPAMPTAVSYFVGCRLPVVIDAEVSTSIQAGIRRGASYSLT